MEGAAGLGKSWLVRAFAERLEGERVPVVGVAPPGVLTGLLRAAAPWLEGERQPAFLAAARRVLPDHPWALIAEEPGEVDATLEVVRALERAVARLGGACLIFEDAHTYSADDLAVLQLLYRRLTAARSSALLVVTARPDSGLLERFTVDASLSDGLAPEALTLHQLDLHGVAQLVQGVLHTAELPEGLDAWLLERAEGHPLHTQELLRFLIGSGFVRDFGAARGFTAPPSSAYPRGLEAVLQARLRAAQPESDLWRALGTLAVVERPLTLSAWARASGLSAERAELVAARALNIGLARTEASAGALGYELTHPLYPALVRAAHAQLDLEAIYTRALEIARDPSERARWARLARDPRAAQWTREALTALRDTGAWAAQLAHLDALLHLEPDAGDRDELHLERGTARFRLSDYGGALEVLLPLETAPAVELACLVYARLGRDRDGLAYSTRWLERFDADTNFHLRFYWACFHARLGDAQTARTWLEHLRATASNVQQQVSAFEGWDWYWKIYHPDQPLERLRMNLEGLAAERAGGEISDQSHANHLIFIAENYTALREFEQAQEGLERCKVLLNRSGHRDTLMIYQLHLGQWMLGRGQPVAARSALLKSYTLAREARDPIHTAHALLELAKAECLIGDIAAVTQRLEQFERATDALDRQPSGAPILYHHDPDLEVAALRAQLGLPWHATPARLEGALGDDAIHAGLLLLLTGDAERAQAALERPTEPNTREHPLRALLMGAVALRSGNRQTARAHLEHARVTARAQRTEHLEAEAEIALGFAATDPMSARRLAQGGLAVLESLRCTGAVLKWRLLFPILASSLLDLAIAKPVTAAKPARFIRTFGAFGLEEHGEVKPWKARKTRELLALLLCAHVSPSGPGVPRDTLIDALWPDAEPDRAESTFRVTLNRLRESLGDAARIERDANGQYALVEPKSDLMLFLESSHRRDLEGALAWYAGPFLPGMDLDTVDDLRADLRTRWRDAARQLVVESDLARGAQLLEALHDDDPLDLGVLERLVSHLRELGDGTRLSATLERAAKRSRAELGFVPAELERWTREAALQRS